VLLPLQLIFCHPQQADQISAHVKGPETQPTPTEKLHEVSSGGMRSERGFINRRVNFPIRNGYQK
jgi:hypothetical protein